MCVALREKKARREYEQAQDNKRAKASIAKIACVLHCKIASAIKSDERFEKKKEEERSEGGRKLPGEDPIETCVWEPPSRGSKKIRKTR